MVVQAERMRMYEAERRKLRSAAAGLTIGGALGFIAVYFGRNYVLPFLKDCFWNLDTVGNLGFPYGSYPIEQNGQQRR